MISQLFSSLFLPVLPGRSCCPCGSCFEAAWPQGFVKYLAKYEAILYADDREEIFYCYEGNLLVGRINFTDVEDTLFRQGG